MLLNFFLLWWTTSKNKKKFILYTDPGTLAVSNGIIESLKQISDSAGLELHAVTNKPIEIFEIAANSVEYLQFCNRSTGIIITTLTIAKLLRKARGVVIIANIPRGPLIPIPLHQGFLINQNQLFLFSKRLFFKTEGIKTYQGPPSYNNNLQLKHPVDLGYPLLPPWHL